MRTLRPGAQRASLHTRLSVLLAASLFASLFAFGVSATAPSAASAATTPTWYTVETYYLSLLNCTRTGGWVRSNGTCAGYGSGRYSKYVAPLKRTLGLSNVARRWATKIATAGACKHGDPGARLYTAGYHGWTWGENIGCWDLASAKASVLQSHLAFQREKSSGGGHWKNIKNSRFHYVGIGVWQANGHTRLVVDFYTP